MRSRKTCEPSPEISSTIIERERPAQLDANLGFAALASAVTVDPLG